MALNKKLPTGTILCSWNYDDGNSVGQTVAVRNAHGADVPIVHAESVNCQEGLVNRIIIKRSVLERLGWTIIEE